MVIASDELRNLASSPPGDGFSLVDNSAVGIVVWSNQNQPAAFWFGRTQANELLVASSANSLDAMPLKVFDISGPTGQRGPAGASADFSLGSNPVVNVSTFSQVPNVMQRVTGTGGGFYTLTAGKLLSIHAHSDGQLGRRGVTNWVAPPATSCSSIKGRAPRSARS